MSLGTTKQIGRLWSSLPHRAVFLGLFAVWIALFHWLGNSTLGYVNTPSIFGWLNALYNRESTAESGDELCPIIPFIVLALFYLKREELISVPKNPWATALCLVVLGLMAHAMGFIVQQTRISVVGFVIGGFGLMGVVWGRHWLRAVLFPWFFLVAAIPISSYLDTATYGLRLLSSKISVTLCRAILGLDLIRQETQVSLPPSGKSHGFHFEVAAACSGMRSLTAVLLISVLFAYLNYRSWWRRAVIILTAIPLALGGNVLRLCTVFVVGDALGEEAGRLIETKMGFITWVAALAGLFQIGRFLREPVISQVVQSDETGSVSPSNFGSQKGGRLPAWVPTVPLVLMASAVAFIFHVRSNQRVGLPGVRLENIPLISDSGTIARTNSVHLPLTIEGYRAETVAITDLEFNYLPPDTSFGRVAYYSPDSSFVSLASVVLMGTDRTSIHRPEYCLTSQGWRIRQQSLETVHISGTAPVELQVQRFDTLISGQDSKGYRVEKAGVYVFWFVADGELTAHHTTRQWLMMKNLVLNNLVQRWAYISFFAECSPGDEENCYRRLAGLISQAYGGIVRAGNRAQGGMNVSAHR